MTLRSSQVLFRWVLDAVGVGFTSLRTSTAIALTNAYPPAVIWTNVRELREFAAASGAIDEDRIEEGDAERVARVLARSRKCVVAWIDSGGGDTILAMGKGEPTLHPFPSLLIVASCSSASSLSAWN